MFFGLLELCFEFFINNTMSIVELGLLDIIKLVFLEYW